MPTPVERQVLFVARYDGSENHVFSLLRKAIEQIPQILSDNKRVSQRDKELLGTIKLIKANHIYDKPSARQVRTLVRQSPFVVAYIGPEQDGKNPQWSPNVFYELGFAEDQGVPVFAFCKASFHGRLKELPFDAADLYVFPYDERAPHGDANLITNLHRWLYTGDQPQLTPILKILRLAPFIESTRDAIACGREDWSPALWEGYSILDAYAVRIRELVDLVKKYDRNKQRATIDLEEGGNLLVGGLFDSAVQALRAGDCYDAVSTHNFWAALPGEGRRFFDVNRAALERGVDIRRLFVCRSTGMKLQARIQAEHKALERQQGKYSCLFCVVNEFNEALDKLDIREGNLEPRHPVHHQAVFRYKGRGEDSEQPQDRVVALRPTYAKDGVFRSIVIKPNATIARDNFELLWGYFLRREQDRAADARTTRDREGPPESTNPWTRDRSIGPTSHEQGRESEESGG